MRVQGRYLFVAKKQASKLVLCEVEVYSVAEQPGDCGEGWFWERRAGGCERCPYNGSSVRETDGNAYSCRCPEGMFGDGSTCRPCPFNGAALPPPAPGPELYSCRCPPGYAMTYGVEVGGQPRDSCVPSSTVAGCDSVADVRTGHCYKFEREVLMWGAAQDRCTAWAPGAQLASLDTGREMAMAAKLVHGNGVLPGNREYWVWVGHHVLWFPELGKYTPKGCNPRDTGCYDCSTVFTERSPPTLHLRKGGGTCESFRHGKAFNARGYLCAREPSMPFQCPSGTYWSEPDFGCLQCPYNASLFPRTSRGKCVCPEGMIGDGEVCTWPTLSVAPVAYGNLVHMCLGPDGDYTATCEATQSSDYWGDSYFNTHWEGTTHAARAIDGDWNPNPFARSCSKTSTRSAGWWRVDLGQRRLVSWLRVWDRPVAAEGMNERLVVEVGDFDAPGASPACFQRAQRPAEDPRALSWTATCNASGRYLFLRPSTAEAQAKEGGRGGKFWSSPALCEVEVYSVAEQPGDCGEGWFWERRAGGCERCPYNGSSVRETDGNAYSCRCPEGMFGDGSTCRPCPFNGAALPPPAPGPELYSCRCPPGYAMTYGVEVGGQPRDSCVPAADCREGVLDPSTNKCWTVERAAGLAWAEAEQACVEGSGHLASVASQQDLAVVRALYKAHRQHQTAWWVGASHLFSASGGAWSDGSAFHHDPAVFQSAPSGRGYDCGVVGDVTAYADKEVKVHFFSCTRRWDYYAVDLVSGHVCAKTLCDSGTYWLRERRECQPCPSGGTSSRGSNHAISACQCPDGMFSEGAACSACPTPERALEGAYPPGSSVYGCQCPPGWSLGFLGSLGGADRVECVLSNGCEGVVDLRTQRCWLFNATGPNGILYHDAAEACRARGAELASLQLDEDMVLAAKIFFSRVPRRLHATMETLWVGMRNRLGGLNLNMLEGWAWEDSAPFHFAPEHWRNVPNEQHGDVAGIAPYSPTEVRIWNLPEGGSNAGHKWGSNVIGGFLCATPPQCANGTYWGGWECRGCPSGGSSVQGFNFNVFGCTCPPGTALSHSVVDGEMVVECVEAWCDGVWDAGQQSCWRLLLNDGPAQPAWQEAQDACCAAGGTLGGVESQADMLLASAALWATSYWAPGELWVAGVSVRSDGSGEWSDGGALRAESVVWEGAGTPPGAGEWCCSIATPSGGGSPGVRCRACHAMPSRVQGFLCKTRRWGRPCATGAASVLLCGAAKPCEVAQGSQGWGGEPERAVDGGGKDGRWKSRSCMHTLSKDGKRWWRADLGESATVGDVKIWNRAGFWDRLSNFQIWVTDTDDPAQLQLSSQDDELRCYRHSGELVTSEESPLVAPCGRAGRFVWIALESSYLHVCEVEIWSAAAPAEEEAGSAGPGWDLSVVDASCPTCIFVMPTGGGVLGKLGVCELSCKSFALEHKNVTALGARSFAGMAHITSLSLRGNALSRVGCGSFAPLTNLESLDLSFNALDKLLPGELAGLHALGALDLRYNQLRSIEYSIFRGLDALRFLLLGGNPWECKVLVPNSLLYADAAWNLEAPPCVTHGCTAHASVVWANESSRLDAALQSRFAAARATIDIVRGDMAQALDHAMVDAGVYVRRGAWRCWCVELAECFRARDLDRALPPEVEHCEEEVAFYEQGNKPGSRQPPPAGTGGGGGGGEGGGSGGALPLGLGCAAAGGGAAGLAYLLWAKRRWSAEEGGAGRGVRLLVYDESGEAKGEVPLEEGKEVAFGREADPPCRLDHESCSRLHASFLLSSAAPPAPPQLTVTDHATANGTEVNGGKIPPSEAVAVFNGDNVTFGSDVRRFVVAGLPELERAGSAGSGKGGGKLVVDGETLAELRRLSREARESGEVLHVREHGGGLAVSAGAAAARFIAASQRKARGDARGRKSVEEATVKVELGFSGAADKVSDTLEERFA